MAYCVSNVTRKVMKYMGSKNRIAKHIIPIMLENRKLNQYFVEPMVGGANVIDKVSGNRIGADKSKYLIAMWNGLQENRNRPNKIPKDLYDVARDVFNGKETDFNHIMEMDDFMVGWIGFMASFNGRFFDGGYNGNYLKRDYTKESIDNVEKQIAKIKDVEFVYSSYTDLDIPNESIIYCDIPYKDTKQYSTSKDFNHNKFWQWCRDMTSKGHLVYISEYNAPSDFQCVWQMEVTNSMNTTNTMKPIEKLFLCGVDGEKNKRKTMEQLTFFETRT